MKIYIYKGYLTIIYCLLFIIIILHYPNKYPIKKILYSNTISYKGEKILKSTLINNYLSGVSDDYISEKAKERKRLNNYFNLAFYSNETFIHSELKKKFLEEISNIKNKNITHLDIFFLSHNLNFGNNLLAINNAIFYCEIVGCHKIILNENYLKRRLLINKPIYDKKINLTIMIGSNIDCNKNNVLCFYEVSWCVFFPRIIVPQVRTNIIKSEILSNLPKVKIEPDSLYIHIRGGDIFKSSIGRYYSQPPLCFYEKIIKDNIFKEIFIISIDKDNIIIESLLNKYNNIIYLNNDFEYDISLLCHAHNIVLSVSSFSISAIKLNDNLKNIWEFDIMRLNQKFLFLHHHLFKFNIQYKIHTMKPSNIYLSKMFLWRRTKEQLKLMIEDKCPNNFFFN